MKRSKLGFRHDLGITLIETILIISILGILAGWIRPIARVIHTDQKIENVRRDLNILAKALETYWLDNHMGTADVTYSYFPTSLSASGFYGVHYPADPNIYIDDFDNWASSGEESYKYSVSGTPLVATIYSVGPDQADDSGGNDDISITVSSERIGRWITRQKLRDIGRAVIDYIVGNKLVSSSDAWSLSESATLCSTNFGLDTWYDKDGWGRQWQINTSHYRIYSSGPDGTDDTGDNATALADDDIGW